MRPCAELESAAFRQREPCARSGCSPSLQTAFRINPCCSMWRSINSRVSGQNHSFLATDSAPSFMSRQMSGLSDRTAGRMEKVIKASLSGILSTRIPFCFCNGVCCFAVPTCLCLSASCRTIFAETGHHLGTVLLKSLIQNRKKEK